MDHPDLEKKLKELMEKKKKLRHDFTRKSVEAINKSEQAALTHMSIMDSQFETNIKGKTVRKKKKPTESSVAVEGPAEDSDS